MALGNRSDRQEVAQKIEWKRFVKRGIDSLGRSYQKQCVAICCRVESCLGRDVTAGSWFILDYHGLAKPIRQRLSNDSSLNVGRAARRIADDQSQKSRRVGLRPRDLWCRQQRGSCCGELQEFATFEFHRAL